MAFDKALYPAHWQALRATVKERSGDRCEWEDGGRRCNLENADRVHRQSADPSVTIPCLGADCMACWATEVDPRPLYQPAIRIILTVAHTCDEEPKCADLDHLRHWCQRHHLNYDRAHHLAVQKRNRDARKAAAL